MRCLISNKILFGKNKTKKQKVACEPWFADPALACALRSGIAGPQISKPSIVETTKWFSQETASSFKKKKRKEYITIEVPFDSCLAQNLAFFSKMVCCWVLVLRFPDYNGLIISPSSEKCLFVVFAQSLLCCLSFMH